MLGTVTVGRSRLLTLTVLLVGVSIRPHAAVALEAWSWPVVGAVLRAFDPPKTAFTSGHRGIDIACWPDAQILAVAPGTVTFAGNVAGQRYVTVTHMDGTQSTASWVQDILVKKGAVVSAGTPLATCGSGHPSALIPHVHIGFRSPDGSYIDPMEMLAPPDLSTFIRLVPRL